MKEHANKHGRCMGEALAMRDNSSQGKDERGGGSRREALVMIDGETEKAKLISECQGEPSQEQRM